MSTNLARKPASEATPAWQKPLAPRPAADRVAVPEADGDPAAAPDRCLPIVHDPGDPRCERLRVLRTELQWRRDAAGPGDIVVLLSPCAGEGRSQLAAELAIAFAQSGQHTLLVDADLRRPRQHTLFGVADGPGLVQAIEGGARQGLHGVAGVPRLSLLTAGGTPTDPLQLLGGHRFRALVADWRSRFEQVVIDTPPVGPNADGLTVAAVAGRVLAVSRAGHTPVKDLQRMLTRLAALRAQVLGAVISHY